jgi:hypothetical protein
MFLKSCLLVLGSLLASAQGFLLAPTQNHSSEVQTAVILIQGASIAPKRYDSLAKALHDKFGKNIWVAIPETVFETPLPILGTGLIIDGTKAILHANGFPEDGEIFLAGHSLGGLAVQEYAHAHPQMAKGLILMGSALLRKFNDSSANRLPIPVMSLNGELDGQVTMFSNGIEMKNIF